MEHLLGKEELLKFAEWNSKHYTKTTCEYYDDGTSPVNPQGAIGGRLTFCFTPTGIGVIAVIKCACGEKVNVTDFDSW